MGEVRRDGAEDEAGVEEGFPQLMLGPFHRGEGEVWKLCCAVGAGAAVWVCVRGCVYCMGHPYEFGAAALTFAEEEEEGGAKEEKKGGACGASSSSL